jgi:hypothetical protein
MIREDEGFMLSGNISMPGHKKLALIHLASTAWFILCVGYVGVVALLQAGVKWWILFSLSGYGVLIAPVLISLYMFAIFRGISSSQKVKVEHPLTNTTQYAFFYVTTPLLGALAGCLGMIGVETFSRFLLGMTLGTLAMTFLVWIILDPVIGLLEMLLPSSRRYYHERIGKAKAEKEKRQRDNERLLAEVSAAEESNRHRWQELLKPQAEKLAVLLAADQSNFRQAEREAIRIGANAWKIGGIHCMRELRNMALACYTEIYDKRDFVDYISFWWDGIGNWRNLSID